MMIIVRKAVYAATLLGVSIVLAAGPVIPDVEGTLIGMGFKNGIFDISRAGEFQLDPGIERQVGAVEGDYTLDTSEEFLTAAYYSMDRLPEAVRKGILAGFPAGREGGLRLCAMWLFKMAERPSGVEGCRKAVRIVMKKSSLSASDVTDYYDAAVRDRINRIPMSSLSAQEQDMLRSALTLYLLDPTVPAHLEGVKRQIDEFASRDEKKSSAARDYLKRISPLVESKLQ